jgi:hypothetical protein
MAPGVEGMRAGKVARKVIFLTLGTAIFIFCLTALYESMRAVMDVGGACASGGAYEIRQACPKGVGWVIPVSIFGMFAAGIFTFLGLFDGGGPRPYVFAWSALFLALGWNFLDYGFNPPDHRDIVWGWVICGFVFVVMGGAPFLLLFSRGSPAGRSGVPTPSAPTTTCTRTSRRRSSPPSRTPPRLLPRPRRCTRAPRTRARRLAPEPAPALVRTPPPKDLFAPPPAKTPPKPVAEPRPKGDVVERLVTLADLRERGMLDDDQYEKAKNAVLGKETT